MSAMLKGVFNFFRPVVSTPIVNSCLQAFRGMANHRHKKIIKLAKGYRGRANRCFTVAYHRVTKARQYAYRDRKVILRGIYLSELNKQAKSHFPYFTPLFRSKNVIFELCGFKESTLRAVCMECRTVF